MSQSRADEIGPPRREQVLDAINAASAPLVVAFGAVKGRTPRTLTATLLADAIGRRGMRVLVVEGGLSNASLDTSFGLPPDAPSYLQAREQAQSAWALPGSLHSLVVQSAAIGADLLLARAAGSQSSTDLTLNEWARLMNGVRALAQYDLVIVDMDTDTQRLPYLLMNVRAGDRLLLALAPDDKEVHRATAALTWLGFAGGEDQAPPLLAYLERHADDLREVERAQRNIHQAFPRALTVGTIPRAPRQLLADARGSYVSPFTLAPSLPLATALHALAARLCEIAGIERAGPAKR